MQLGALTPFYRNHNSVGEMEQAPYVFGEPYTSYIRNAMNIRYAILPYMYALFHGTSSNYVAPLPFVCVLVLIVERESRLQVCKQGR